MNKILLILMLVVVSYEATDNQARVIAVSDDFTEVQVRQEERVYTLSISLLDKEEIGKCINYSVIPFTKWVLTVKQIPTELCH
jgi:hypothetical protein